MVDTIRGTACSIGNAEEGVASLILCSGICIPVAWSSLWLSLFFFSEESVSSQVRRWVALVGNGYVDLLRMLIIPLVPTSIIAGLLRLGNTQELRRMGG